MVNEFRDIANEGKGAVLAASVFIDAAFRATVFFPADAAVTPLAGVVRDRAGFFAPSIVRTFRTALQFASPSAVGATDGAA